jgi:hypothetical protein
MTSVFRSNKIKLEVYDLYSDSARTYEINKSKSIYSQIHAKLELMDDWDNVKLCGDGGVVLCSILEQGPRIEFDAKCKKEIAKFEAVRPRKSIYLRVEFREYDAKCRQRQAREREFEARRVPERRRLKGMTIQDIEQMSLKMHTEDQGAYRQKFGVDTPCALMYPDYRMRVEHPWDAAARGPAAPAPPAAACLPLPVCAESPVWTEMHVY